LRHQAIRVKETERLRDEDIRISKRREWNCIWRRHCYRRTNNLTPHHTDATQRLCNNAQHPISHFDHDGQHLLPAAGSRDADGHGNGHGAKLFVFLASRHTQPCSRILCQLGILRAQKKGKSLSLMSWKCGATGRDFSQLRSRLTWLICSHV
jgi:hypothetical protein